MPIIKIPANKNVGKSLKDINDNFEHLDKNGKDKAGEYTQDTPSKVWVVLHSLGKRPSVTVIDDSGAIVLCDMEYTDENTVVLRFSEPTAGTVYLN